MRREQRMPERDENCCNYNDYGYDDDYEDKYNEDNDEYFFTDYGEEEPDEEQ